MRMAPEFRLFCLALRRPQQAEDLAALRREITAGPDWDRVLEGTRRHRVASLLLAGLKACRSPDLPASVIAELRRRTLAAATHSLAQTREIARLARLFAHAGIRVLALKGVVLSAQLYGDPGLRDPRDIDILVDPEAFSDAEALLVETGYHRSGPMPSPRQSAAYRRWIKDVEYLDAASGMRIELHHRLTDNPALALWDLEQLWRERGELELVGTVIATLVSNCVGIRY